MLSIWSLLIQSISSNRCSSNRCSSSWFHPIGFISHLMLPIFLQVDSFELVWREIQRARYPIDLSNSDWWSQSMMTPSDDDSIRLIHSTLSARTQYSDRSNEQGLLSSCLSQTIIELYHKREGPIVPYMQESRPMISSDEDSISLIPIRSMSSNSIMCAPHLPSRLVCQIDNGRCSISSYWFRPISNRFYVATLFERSWFQSIDFIRILLVIQSESYVNLVCQNNIGNASDPIVSSDDESIRSIQSDDWWFNLVDSIQSMIQFKSYRWFKCESYRWFKPIDPDVDTIYLSHRSNPSKWIARVPHLLLFFAEEAAMLWSIYLINSSIDLIQSIPFIDLIRPMI